MANIAHLAPESRAGYCRERYGYFLAEGPSGEMWVHVHAGADPHDGLPLFWSRPATPREAEMWEQGEAERLAVHLAGTHMPAGARITGIRPTLWETIKRALGWS